MTYFRIYVSLGRRNKAGKNVPKEGDNDRLAQKAMLAGAAVTLIGLIFIPQVWPDSSRPSWWLTYGANAGVVGDTIGGIAGPILNFTGLLLVYYSLREQFKANQQQARQHEYDSTAQLLERFLALLDKHKEVFTKLPQLEFANRLKLKTTIDENLELPLGYTAMQLRQSELRQIVGLFHLITVRIPLLTAEQKQSVAQILVTSYRHWLQACHDSYALHFAGAHADLSTVTTAQIQALNAPSVLMIGEQLQKISAIETAFLN